MTIEPAVLGLAEHMTALAQRNLERDGHLTPVAFVVQGTGALAVYGLSYRTDAQKDAAFAHVRMVARGARAVVLIMEAWVVEVQPGRELPTTRPSLHPARREALVVEVADCNGLRECWQCPFVRQGRRVRWGERQRFTEFSSRHLDPLFRADA